MAIVRVREATPYIPMDIRIRDVFQRQPLITDLNHGVLMIGCGLCLFSVARITNDRIPYLGELIPSRRAPRDGTFLSSMFTCLITPSQLLLF